MFSGFIVNVVCCAVLQIIASIMLPEGRMRAFTLSIIGLYLFFSIVSPLCDFLFEGGVESIFSSL